MTQADQLARALEALCDCISETRGKDANDALRNARQALAAYRAQASTTGAATTGAAVLPEQAVAWRLRIGDSDGWAYCETESAAIFVGKASGLRFVAEPLYASPHQVAQPLSEEQKAVLVFLIGCGPLEGVWFGERHPKRTGLYWWRSILSKAFNTSTDKLAAPTKEQP